LAAFYIDPVRPVARALVTHAHSDHARSGHEASHSADPSTQTGLERLTATLSNPLDYPPEDTPALQLAFVLSGHRETG